MIEDEITNLEMIKVGMEALLTLVVIVFILLVVLLVVGSILPWAIGFIGYCWNASGEAANEFFKSII